MKKKYKWYRQNKTEIFDFIYPIWENYIAHTCLLSPNCDEDKIEHNTINNKLIITCQDCGKTWEYKIPKCLIERRK